MNIGPFAPADLDGVAVLGRQCLGLAQFDARLLARDFLLAPGFRAEHLLVARAGGEVAGFLLAPRSDALGGPGRGWIAAFGVAPGHRRRGLATRLVEAGLDGMRRDDVRAVDVADVPVRYLLPGVDRAAFPDAYALLTGKFGFALREEVASMGIRLDRDFPTAPAIRPAALGELPLVRDFFAAGWDAGWWAHLERSTLGRLMGDPAPSDILGWWEGGRPLGLVHYRGNRFGPLAVGEAARGRGIGAALTLAALAAMRREGLADAYFLVGRADVQPFYARLGFTVLRRFAKLRLVL